MPFDRRNCEFLGINMKKVMEGTIFTPIILSLQGTFKDYAELIYWIVLSVSTVTGILNMTIELFKFRDNYIISKLALESLKSEGWSTSN